MHMFIFPNTNKAIMFDSLLFGPSQIRLPKMEDDEEEEEDSWAHAVEYDTDTAAIRPLKILTDTWCSSGGLSANGTLVHTGGWGDGGRSVRYMISGCSTCDWKEYPEALNGTRWYSTQHILPDGSFIVVGGRSMYNYEYVPEEGKCNEKLYGLPFLKKTTDPCENNLYPFVFLSTDGNIFIFANNRSILLSPTRNKVVRELPVLSGGSRNHPASAMSTLLPIKLHDPEVIQAKVLICGGAKHDAALLAEKAIFVDALQDCATIDITNPKATWHKETMPSPRVMGDMIQLPTGDVLMINGAKKGTAGWNFAEDPNLTPVLYRPEKPKTQRYSELTPTTIPRMSHSTSVVLPDGKILVAGGNPNYYYNFTGLKYPTEVRVEKFYPPYLDPFLASDCPSIISNFKGKKVKYSDKIVIQFKLKKAKVNKIDFKVTMYAPPFTTHGFSMGQRLLVLRINKLISIGSKVLQVTVAAPPRATIAPPGYYLLFVVYRGVPSTGIWVQIA
ncbi:Glyoxal_oxid_N domain-containing protein/DUF1929 domain-containing protein [Cephalotus follicularis]|uniref:Glyoxal_oxid_N domain-containing protein/DUF1929 domain-containing protein n=1 Tax=Cephalotus follicularis TaxID=3775 RepID=A0A1Q3CX21_CEPFO|nr:Glyoxal_oxid_N domain-containing protein/DUF1929 domain-containing protein [Cephalotus follicularis]